MTYIKEISLGEILMFVATVSTFIVALFIGIKQNKINEKLLKVQDIIALFIDAGTKKIEINDAEVTVPAMVLYNLGTTVVYLEYYIFNGRKYPVGAVTLPTRVSFPEFSYKIDLPTNGETHVSFEIFIIDSLDRRWYTEGFADFNNGSWQIMHLQCKRFS